MFRKLPTNTKFPREESPSKKPRNQVAQSEPSLKWNDENHQHQHMVPIRRNTGMPNLFATDCRAQHHDSQPTLNKPMTKFVY